MGRPIAEHNKRCSCCGVIRLKTDFYTNNASSDGLLAKCILCVKKKSYAARENMSEVERFIRKKYSAWRASAHNRGKKWHLSVNSLIKLYNEQKGLCARTSEKMTFEKHDPNIMSLDCIDSTKNYTINNVQFLTDKENTRKNDGTPQDDMNRFITYAVKNGITIVPPVKYAYSFNATFRDIMNKLSVSKEVAHA